jgi:hypothetical protein
MLAFISLPLGYALTSLVSYAESPVTSPGLVLGLPLPHLTLRPYNSHPPSLNSLNSITKLRKKT